MSTSGPSPKVIKRLFALSGNKCAFSGCTSRIIGESGVVLGQVCHIKAHKPEGPRHDPGQSMVERHAFENLILMCSVHHKVIDDEFDKYSVQELLRIKREHENREPAGDLSDREVEDVLQNSGLVSSVSQHSGNGGVNVVATGGSVVVNNGLSYADVQGIALDVFHANAVKLGRDAQETVRARVEGFTSMILGAMQRRSPAPPAILADPDFQHTLLQAQMHTARNSSRDLRDVLADLVSVRAGLVGGGLLEIVLNEAVQTAGRLTPDQFDALTLVFVLRYTVTYGLSDVGRVADHLERCVTPFLSGASRTLARFQHLQYAGCGSIELGSASLHNILARNYGHCFLSEIVGDELWQVFSCPPHLRAEVLGSLGFVEVRPNIYSTTGFLDGAAPEIVVEKNLSSDTLKKFGKLMEQKANTLIVPALKERYPLVVALETWWNGHPSHFQLTSVGIALAHANLRRRGVKGFDLGVWIN